MDLDQHNQEKREEKAENLKDSLAVLLEAKKLAAENNLVLEQHSQWHYSLTLMKNGARKWRINVYPSNQRIWWDRRCGKAPFLDLPVGWTLLDVVKKAVELL